jgi:hypothetical protein
MDSIGGWSPVTADKLWTEEEKQNWLAAHAGEVTHFIAYEPVFQLELCIPPWEDVEHQITRSAQAWGKVMSSGFEEAPLGAATVLAAHHEANAIEICARVRARPRLYRVV